MLQLRADDNDMQKGVAMRQPTEAPGRCQNAPQASEAQDATCLPRAVARAASVGPVNLKGLKSIAIEVYIDRASKCKELPKEGQDHDAAYIQALTN